MKILPLLLVFLVAGLARAQSGPALGHIREELKSLRSIEGVAVGFAGIPGRFYLLYPYCVTYGEEVTLLDFLKDENAIVAVMGALCLIDKFPEKREEVMQRMKRDERSVAVFAGGCMGESMAVKALFEKIAADADFVVPMRFRKNPPPRPPEAAPKTAPPPVRRL
ncbi:MAG: hypothetical protein ABIZ49_09385 [Opitutaceae bacterium]